MPGVFAEIDVAASWQRYVVALPRRGIRTGEASAIEAGSRRWCATQFVSPTAAAGRPLRRELPGRGPRWQHMVDCQSAARTGAWTSCRRGRPAAVDVLPPWT